MPHALRLDVLRRYRKLTAATIILLVLLGIYLWPLLDTHPEQDACSFGPITNERYRELLVEAKRRQATTWPAIRERDTKKTNTILNERFDDLSRGMTSVYERLAAMHAIMRAMVGDYRQTGGGINDPYPKFYQDPGVMPYAYHVDLNRLYFFSPFRRQLKVNALLVMKDGATVVQDSSRARLGNIDFSTFFPRLLENYSLSPRSQFGGVCPIVPDAVLAERLRRSEK